MRASLKQFTSEVLMLQEQFSKRGYQKQLLRRAREIRQIFDVTMERIVANKLKEMSVELDDFLKEKLKVLH